MPVDGSELELIRRRIREVGREHFVPEISPAGDQLLLDLLDRFHPADITAAVQQVQRIGACEDAE